MGLLDDAKDKVSGLLHGHEDQVKDGIDKAAAKAAESKLGTEHASQIEDVAEKAKDAIDKLSE
jgi:hypothetical protein